MIGPVGPARGAATTEALRAALEENLGQFFGRPYPIARLEREVSDYSSSFTVEELDVYGAGAAEPLRLIFKNLSWQSLLPESAGVRPRFLHEPRREIAVYQRVLAGLGMGTPACYGAVVDDAAEAYWLFLERVEGDKLSYLGEREDWQRVATWLARLHARLAHLAQNPPADLRLLRYDADWYRLWLRRAEPRLARVAELGPPGAAERLRSLAREYDAVVEHLLALAPTVIHGEFYPNNVLIQSAGGEAGGEAGGQVRVCPVDWETAAVGPGLMDLSALNAGDWSEEHRRGMAAAYRAELIEQGAAAPGLDEMMVSLDYCHLHQAMQWVGWASDWEPPADQARDWEEDVLGLADRLGL